MEVVLIITIIIIKKYEGIYFIAIHGFSHDEDKININFNKINLKVNCESLSVFGASLANGGTCPTTGEEVRHYNHHHHHLHHHHQHRQHKLCHHLPRHLHDNHHQ